MIFVSKDRDIINHLPDDIYFQKVKRFILLWDDGITELSVKTSGSTGPSQTIKLSKKRISSSVKLTTETFDLNENTIFICNLSIDHIAGKLMIIRALELNSELYIFKPDADLVQNLLPFEHTLNKNRGNNFFAFVPLQISKILGSEKGYDLLNKAKSIIIGGAEVHKVLAQKIEKIISPVFATYGMTETVTHIAIKRLNGDNIDINFKALANVSLDLNESDCLQIKSDSTDNMWINTNDKVILHGKNTFQLLGRIDHIINSGGLKLNLDLLDKEIDQILRLNQDFFCFGEKDEVLGQKLILYIESEFNNKEISNQLRSSMSKFNAPKEVRFIPKFVRTFSGKIDKIKTAYASSIPNK